MSRVLEWDGKNLPEGLRSLPPGRYVVESLEDDIALTPEEEQGLRDALASLEAGNGRALDDVRERVRRTLNR